MVQRGVITNLGSRSKGGPYYKLDYAIFCGGGGGGQRGDPAHNFS